MNSILPIDREEISREVETYNKRETSLIEQYRSIQITNHLESVDVANELKTVKQHLKQISDREAEIMTPLKSAIESVRELFAPPKRLLSQAESILKAKISLWQESERQRIAEERRRAEELARQERERLAREAEKARQAEQKKLEAARLAETEAQAKRAQSSAERMAEKAVALEAQSHMIVPPVVHESPKLEGISTRKTWRAEVVDIEQLIKAVAAGQIPSRVLKPDQAELNKLARALQNNLSVPGVRVVVDEVVAVRT